MAEEKVLIVRKEGTGTYGLGEEVAPNCTLFRAGFYGLTREELFSKVAASNNKAVSDILLGKTTNEGETL